MDLAEFGRVRRDETEKGLKRATNNVNAISAACLLPHNLPIHRCMLPVLHLILGVVNDIVKEIRLDMASVQGKDKTDAERELEEAEELKELKVIQRDNVLTVLGLIEENDGSGFKDTVRMDKINVNSKVIKHFPGHDDNPEPPANYSSKHWEGTVLHACTDADGRVIHYRVRYTNGDEEELPTKHWESHLVNDADYIPGYQNERIQQRAVQLRDEFQDELEHLEKTGPVNNQGTVVTSKRAVDSHEKKVADLKEKLEAMRDGSRAIDAAQKCIDEWMDTHRDTAEDSDLIDKFERLLQKWGISVQKYWSGTLVGPDCRRFLNHWQAILSELQDMVNAARPNADTTLNARYAAILKPLATVSQYTRAVRILNYDEREKLKAACREFDAAYGTCFPEKEYMTPKAAVIVILVPLYVEMYHTLGIFSEEAMESLHPQDNKFRVRVRSVQRPEDRHRALMTFHRLFQTTMPRKREGKKRNFTHSPEERKKQKEERRLSR